MTRRAASVLLSWLAYLLAPPLLAVALAFVLLSSPVWLPMACIEALKAASRRRRFMRKYRGRLILVWTSRRGWHGLIVNNVIPLVRPDLMAVRHSFRRSSELERTLAEVLWRERVGVPRRPYLVRVGQPLRAISVNEHLRDLKDGAKRDSEVQQTVRRRLEPLISQIASPLGGRELHQ